MLGGKSRRTKTNEPPTLHPSIPPTPSRLLPNTHAFKACAHYRAFRARCALTRPSRAHGEVKELASDVAEGLEELPAAESGLEVAGEVRGWRARADVRGGAFVGGDVVGCFENDIKDRHQGQPQKEVKRDMVQMNIFSGGRLI